jgi:hypothetical protein
MHTILIGALLLLLLGLLLSENNMDEYEGKLLELQKLMYKMVTFSSSENYIDKKTIGVTLLGRRISTEFPNFSTSSKLYPKTQTERHQQYCYYP